MNLKRQKHYCDLYLHIGKRKIKMPFPVPIIITEIVGGSNKGMTIQVKGDITWQGKALILLSRYIPIRIDKDKMLEEIQ